MGLLSGLTGGENLVTPLETQEPSPALFPGAVVSGGFFTGAWVQRYRHIPESAMVATIEIYDPNLSQSVYDPETNDYTDVRVAVYAGKARVQPIRSDRRAPVSGNDTTVQTVLFSIPISFKSLTLMPWYQVKVLESPLNPSLTAYTYVMSEMLDSSNPIERTFYCTVDLENVSVQ